MNRFITLFILLAVIAAAANPFMDTGALAKKVTPGMFGTQSVIGSDTVKSVYLGTLPTGAIVTDVDIEVVTAYDSGDSTNNVTIGVAANIDSLMTVESIGTAGPTTPTIAKGNWTNRTALYLYYIKPTGPETYATAGELRVVVSYAKTR